MVKANVRMVVGSVFASVGLLLLGVAAVLVVSAATFARAAERAEGTVVDFGRRHSLAVYPYVTYTSPADGREYTFRDKTGRWPPPYIIGERVPVLYDPAHPIDAQIDSWTNTFLGPVLCGGIGVGFTTIGSALLMKARRRAKHAFWLRNHGRERWVDVDHVSQERSVELNGQNPFVIHASWQDERTGRTHTASSEHLWQPPDPRLISRGVRVLFDPTDPDRNVIDLERSFRSS